MEHKWLPWALGGAALVVLYFVMQSGGGASSGGYSVVSQTAPDTSASDAARYGFLESGIGALAQLEGAITQGQFQLAAVTNSNAAAVAAAQAQASAEVASAKASTAGKHGLSLGPFSFHW